MDSTPRLPLTGMQVVECASYVAGPTGGLTLAQLGAEVVRIDPLGGGHDHRRWPLAPSGESYYWSSLNKGKRSVAVDLRSPEGQDLVVALITAPGPDRGLLIDNVVGRPWLAHDALAARRQDLIHLRVQGHPDGRPAVDYTVNAGVGVPQITGPEGADGASEPVNHVLPAWDLITGVSVAAGMLAALHDRERTGNGAFIELALSDVALAGVSNLGWLSEAELRGGDRPRHGNHLYGSFASDFATADGHRVMVVALTEGQWKALQTGDRDDQGLRGARNRPRRRPARGGGALPPPGDDRRHPPPLVRRPRPRPGQRRTRPRPSPLGPLPRHGRRRRRPPPRRPPGPGRHRARRARTPAQPAEPTQQPAEPGTSITARSPLRWNGAYGEPGESPVLGRDTDQVLDRGPRPHRPRAGRPARPRRHLTASSNGVIRQGDQNMPRLAQTAGLTDVQQEILATVKQFVDKEIIPHAQALEHADEYPSDIVAGMREMGLFGLTIGEEYGGLGESLLTYALVVEQIARGWMSVSGIINTHFIVAHMIKQHGTPEQKQKFLPPMAVGEVRGSFSMSEPDLGSDVAAIKTRAVLDPDRNAYVVNGAKMWLTNGGSSNLVALLARTDEGAAKPHQNLTAFLVEKPTGFGEVLPGLTIPGKIDKMGYKGVDTTEALFDNVELPADSVLGGQPGRGFAQMMDGIEVGRVNVSARACGIAIRAFELAIGYAQQRKTFGKPIADHQAIAFKLAEMATKVEAAHLMMVNAARLKDSGERNDVAAGMAKLLASEYCAEVTQDAFRIHGGYGYSNEYEIERLMREAPFLLIGEGTSEIQKMIISRGLLREYKI